MGNVVLPSGQSITQAVGGLISKPVKIVAKKEEKIALQKEYYVGTYDDGSGAVEAAIVMDLPLCASFGCALALIPAAMAKEAVAAKKIEGDMKDNAYEVANILANSFTGRRVRLVGFAPAEQISEQTQSLIKGTQKITSYEVTVQGYPGGTLRFCS